MMKYWTFLIFSLAVLNAAGQDTKGLTVNFYMSDYFNGERANFRAYLNTTDQKKTEEVFTDRTKTLTRQIPFENTGIVWFKSDAFPETFFYVNTHNIPEDHHKWNYQFAVNGSEDYFLVDGPDAKSNEFLIYYNPVTHGFDMKRIQATEKVKKRYGQPRMPE